MVGAFLVVVVPLVVVWAWSLHLPRENGLRVFARRFDVTLDEATRPFLTQRIRSGRCWRALGGSVGWIVASLPLIVSQFRPDLGARFNKPFLSTAPIAGYLLGTVLVELFMAARSSNSPRRALLRFRHVNDYVPGWPITVTRLAAVTGVGLTPVAWSLVDTDLPVTTSYERLLTGLVVIVVGLTFMELALRLVAHRRQVTTTPETLVIDEALRADSARRVAGASMVIVAGAASGQLNAVVYALSPWLTFAGFGLFVLMLGAWWSLLDSTWRHPPSTPAP